MVFDKPRVIGALDPSVRDCGLSLLYDKTVQWGKLVRNPMKSGHDYAACRSMALAVSIHFPRLDILVIEFPRIYTAGKQVKRDDHGNARSTDPNDLLPLVGVGTAVAALMPDTEIVTLYPDEWKGSVSKFAMNIRTCGRLSADERKTVEAKDPDPDKPHDKGHNVWDAVGIGLHYVGRLERVRVIAR